MTRSKHCKTLLGHNQLDFSIECLQSFLHHSYDEIILEIFEDGTITAEDEIKLLAALKNSVIIKKTERNAKVDKLLTNYPACRNYRNSTNFAQKLFDIMLHDDQDVFYIDSDIYFLRKFALPKMEEMPIFMFDTQNAYSFTPLDLLKINVPVFPNVNTGLLYFPKNLFKLDYIEQLLQDKVVNKSLNRHMNWSEQTIWSLLAAKSGSINYFNCKQVIMADFALKVDEHTIAIHLVYYFRTHIKQLRLMQFPETKTCAPISLEMQTSYLRKRDFAMEKIIRKVKKLV